MEKEGAPSFRAADSTLRQTGQQADTLMGHSVGLVRSWALWISDSCDASTDVECWSVQRHLDDSWPHWISEEVAAYFLNCDRSRPEGCSNPAQLLCAFDIDCAGVFLNDSLVCLLNFATPEEELSGICARAGTCYQHAHCQVTDPSTLCICEGTCVQQLLSVSNNVDPLVSGFGQIYLTVKYI
jgi:hypothetical protein